MGRSLHRCGEICFGIRTWNFEFHPEGVDMATATANTTHTEKDKDKKKQSRDPAREVVETIVFVVVLVLLLKLFVTEAFVIPTGSMAETLWGDQIKAECPECGYTFPVS